MIARKTIDSAVLFFAMFLVFGAFGALFNPSAPAKAKEPGNLLSPISTNLKSSITHPVFNEGQEINFTLENRSKEIVSAPGDIWSIKNADGETVYRTPSMCYWIMGSSVLPICFDYMLLLEPQQSTSWSWHGQNNEGSRVGPGRYFVDFEGIANNLSFRIN